MGKASTELKLLACQRNDQTWSAVQGEEVVPTEDTGFEAGALVMVEVGGNRQVQGALKPGGPTIVNLLQSFSKLIVNKKEQEEEIEAWKQSLTIQAQDLNQRQMELEAELGQLDQMREEAQGLEATLKEAEQVKQEASSRQEELERKTQELEQAWEHLRGEQRKLDELKDEVQPAGGLDEEQANRLQELVSYLETTPVPTEALRSQLDEAVGAADEQQGNLDSQWQQLEQQRSEAQGQQEAVDRQGEELNGRRQQLQDIIAGVEQTKRNLQEQQQTLAVKEESVKGLNSQLQAQKELQETLSRLAAGGGDSGGEQAVDINALENMPLGELQSIIDTLQKDIQQVAQFVNEQEEELTAEREEIDEVQQKLEGASDYDRINLEQELADARDRYQMLDQTLVGQRREVRERESVLNQHLRVLRRRQGIVDADPEGGPIDLSPVVSDLEAKQKQTEESVQQLEAEIEQLCGSIQQAEEYLSQQASEQERQQREVQDLEENWKQQQLSIVELWATVNRAQEILQALQERLSEVRGKLDAIAEVVNETQQTSEYQTQAIADLKGVLSALSG